mmetsp:Transcript_18258/g.36753  ORF Transcript_18258/g.36753 Transcript_18258/m.36753 type:complete len:316 (-) Transcript_18258:91-1038(-)
MTNGRKDGKSTNNGEHAVGDTNHTTVQKGRFATRAVGTVGSHGTECDGKGKENLRHGTRPNVGLFAKNSHVPFANVFFNTIRGAVKSDGAKQEDKEEENRKTHGDVCHLSSGLGSKSQTEPNTEPNQGDVSDISTDQSGRVQGTFFSGIHTDNIVEEVSDSFATVATRDPWIIVAEGVKESVGYPREKHGIVGNQNESTKDTGDTYTTVTRVHLAKDTHISHLMRLTQGNFQDQDGQTNQTKGHNVGNKKRSTTKVLRELGETPHISKTDGTSDGCQIETHARVPTFPAASLFGSFRSKRSMSSSNRGRHDGVEV